MAAAIRKAPWPDFVGNPIYEGDLILHPSGERGVVIFLPDEKDLTDQWRVQYANEEGVARLSLQIGEKGRSVVVAPWMDATTTPPGLPAGDVLRPVDIRLVWDDRIRPGIEEIRREGRHTDWRPEDVYHECRAGKALLLVTDDGFVILQTETNEWTLQKEVLIWFAYSKAADFRDRVLPQIEAIARNAGASMLRCLSHRRGLERTGWTPDTIVYKRAL